MVSADADVPVRGDGRCRKCSCARGSGATSRPFASTRIWRRRSGINTFRYKLLAFTISNLLAAFAGALFGFYTNYIEPSQLSITQSLDAIAMVLLGGMGSILGPVVGALLLTGLPHVIEFSAELRAADLWRDPDPGHPRDAARHRRAVLALAPCFLRSTRLTKRFGGLVAVSEVSLQIEEGEIVGILGPNGSGKTTLLNLLAGLLAPTSGKVMWQGRDISGVKPETIAALGLVKTFQNPQLFAELSVRRARHDCRAISRSSDCWVSAATRPCLAPSLASASSAGASRPRDEALPAACRWRRSPRPPCPTARRRCSASPWP